MAAAAGGEVRSVDTDLLREDLRAAGAILEMT
jgi:hypothetical protein